MESVAQGKLDCRQADWRDPSWWRHCRLVLQQMECDDEVLILQAALRLQTSFLGNSQLSEEGWKEVQERCQQILQRLLKRLRPWQKDALPTRESQREAVIRRYKEVYGDPDDPAFQAKLEASLRALEEQDRLEAEQEQKRASMSRREWLRQQGGDGAHAK